MGSGNDTHYVRVDSSKHTITRRGDRTPLNTYEEYFWCRTVNPCNYRIEVGDIIGAYIYDPKDSNNILNNLI